MRNNIDIIRDARDSGYPYVSVFDEVLPVPLCHTLIEKFERNEFQEQTDTFYPGIRHFIEVNISQNWPEQNDKLLAYLRESWKVYQHTHNLQDTQYPKTYGYEAFRMKRYLPNGRDEFALHTDVGSHASARRFVSFLLYLNTVEVGGETQFGPHQEHPLVTIPAVTGRLLMFPPLWTHPHWGCKVTSGPKYILSSYLHYL
jgi:hypothetical protein